MDEIIPYIILILVLLVLELIQSVWAKSKIKKWILPILSFLLSVYIMIYLISFELADQIGIDRKGLIVADSLNELKDHLKIHGNSIL